MPFLILIVRSRAGGNVVMSPIPKRCHDLGFGPGEREGTEEGGVEVDEAAPPATNKVYKIILQEQCSSKSFLLFLPGTMFSHGVRIG